MAKRPVSLEMQLAELQAENRYLRQARNAKGVVLILREIIRCGSLVLIFRYLYLIADAFAGHLTFADIGINVISNIQISQAVAWLLGGSGALYGLRQRNLRKDTIERLQGRNQEYEKRLDPQRSSSKLTPRGDTHPEDRT